MLRYLNVADVTYTDVAGVARAVKAMREIPAYTPYITVQRQPSEPLDAVACRPDVYGAGSEGNAYVLHEASMAAIIDHDFDYAFLARVGVPQP